MSDVTDYWKPELEKALAENKRLLAFLNEATASRDGAIRDKARRLYAEISVKCTKENEK